MISAPSLKRRYLVTGGAGFIGSHLVDALLRAGHAVRVLDDLSTGRRSNLDPRCELQVGDVADPMSVETAFGGVAGCFHLAAIASVARSNEEWVGTHRINATGTVAVLDAARSAGGVPVVYASSAAVYGDGGDGAIAEGTALRPRTAYGADKLASELHARVAFEVHRVPTLGFRFFNVYGPRQDPASPYSGVISLFAGRLAAGRPLSIHGDGGQTRDFVFVADVVEHLLRGMALLEEAPGALVLNVCTGRATSVRALAGLLGDVAGREVSMEFGPARAGDIRASLGDPSAARAALGLAATTRLEDGLIATFGASVPVFGNGAGDA
jgi:UDP-glucose 4-epimerase